MTTTHHGRERVDEYDWLRDKDAPEVSAYLDAENAYTQERTAHLADLRQTVFEEIRARTLETDLSVPVRIRDHWYYGRSFEGREYGASYRVPVSGPDDWTPPQPDEDCAPDQPALPGEELLLDLDVAQRTHVAVVVPDALAPAQSPYPLLSQAGGANFQLGRTSSWYSRNPSRVFVAWDNRA